MAYLSPLEFADPEYGDYLAHGATTCTPISGLFYDPITSAQLKTCKPYGRLCRAKQAHPLVLVFGGGGDVWERIYVRIDAEAQRTFQTRRFALVSRAIHNGKPQRKWAIYLPGRRRPVPLADPGRMVYWYAACDLVVSRGGLAAQQIATTMISDLETAPEMLFVEEPGHPQIEAQRQALHRLGLVHTRTLRGFQNQAFMSMADALEKRAPWRRQLAKVRYNPGGLGVLAGCLLGG